MKVAIAGFGLEGRVNYRYWHDQGHEVTIIDERELPAEDLPDGARVVCGEDVFEHLDEFDFVVRTAGLNPEKLNIETDKIWSATNEFFAKCPAPIVGVTGTKGKGTTSSLIASIFRASGKTTHLVGNIGTAALEELPKIHADDMVVYELSSFQLWDIKKSPQVAVILLIEPDHLNVHRDMGDYVAAKSNIRAYQTEADLCVYHPTNELSAKAAHVSDSGTLQRYAVPDDGGVYEKDGFFWQHDQQICSKDALQLLGQHNVENACAAITVAKRYEISNDAIESGLRNFHGLPHRLEFVRELDGVEYFNDSFSSAPSATLAAVRSFTAPEILILGGTDKGADFSDLINDLAVRKNIRSILVVGEIRDKLAKLLHKAGLDDRVNVLAVRTMNEIVTVARQTAQPGDVVLLSPGCASFDMFRNFYDRGDQFRELVNTL